MVSRMSPVPALAMSSIIALATAFAAEAREEIQPGRAPAPSLVELGRHLLLDPVPSGNGNISCGTCHDPALGSVDGLALGIVEDGVGADPDHATVDPLTGRVPPCGLFWPH